MSGAYLAPSRLESHDDTTFLDLETALGATPQGLVAHPQFFRGFVAHPSVAAAGVLTVADVAQTRFLDLGALMAASRDPVVTASGDRLRFESFSACNGVHARLDLLSDGIDSGEIAFGTTNVDINQPLRTALAGMPRHELMHLGVGPEAVTVSTLDETIEEARVDLPERWVRGFAQVPGIAAGMEQVAEVSGPQAMTFIASLPRSAPGPTVTVGASGGRLRVMAGRRGATLAGTARLGPLKRLLTHLRSLRVYAHESGASGWVADLPGARLTLLVTAQPYRGFSGEGALLDDVGASSATEDAALLLEHLAWEPVIDPQRLGPAAGLSGDRVTAAMAELAASGKVGYDLTDQAWFHRELPLDTEASSRDNPRLVKARTLLAAGAVVRDGDQWRVGEDGREHWVSPQAESCTCVWFVRHRGTRGPCAHALAVRLATP